MDQTETEMIEWNQAVSRVHSAIALDSSVQGVAVTRTPPTELVIVLEPGATLQPSTIAVIDEVRTVLRIRVVDGRTPRLALDAVRAAIDVAAPRVRLRQGTKGVVISTDWVAGKVRLTGDVSGGEAIVNHAGVDRDLVIVEDGPAIQRRPGPPAQ